MTAHGHDCTVYYFDDKKEIQFTCLVKKIRLTNKIDFNKFDVIHSHGLRPDLYIWLHKPTKCNTLCITTLHNYVFQDLKSTYNIWVAFIAGNIWMKLLNKHDYVAVLSKVAKEYYQKKLPPQKIKVTYNTRILDRTKKLSLEEEQEVLRFKNSDYIIGVNAMLTPIKGIDILIKSLSLIEGYKLWIVGDGKSMEDLKRLAKQEKVENKIHFAGYRKDAYRYMPYYDIYAMTSRSEGFGLVLLEAAIYSTPTICSDIPIFRELFSEKEVAFFQLKDKQSLVYAINKAIGNRQMANNMHEKYEQSYSAEQFYLQYFNIYICH